MANKSVNICLCVLIGVWKSFSWYILSGNPSFAIVGDSINLTLTCISDDDYNYVKWLEKTNSFEGFKIIAEIKPVCVISISTPSNGYEYTCNIPKKEYFLSIPFNNVNESLQNIMWKCNGVVGQDSDNWSPSIAVPITSVTISNTPTDENPVKIIKGQGKVFTCKTNAGRPSSKIQWYLASVNITSSATTQSDVCATDCSDGKLISSSQLIYKGNTNDSGQIIYCTASNVEGHGIRSLNKTIDVLFKPVLDHTIPYPPSHVSATENNTLHLTLTLNANPTPTIEWTFRTEADWNSCNFVRIVSNTSTNGFLTSSSILIENVQSSNFGEYGFAANNTVGTFLRRFIVMKEVACLTRENFPITKENHTGMFVAGIVTLVIGLMSLTAAVIFVVRNSLKNKALNSSKSVEYSDVQRSNPAFTDAYTTLQSNIESTVPLEQIINTYEECGKTPEAHTYSSVDKMESDPSQPQHHGVNTYEECGKRDEFEAHAYDTLDK